MAARALKLIMSVSQSSKPFDYEPSKTSERTVRMLLYYNKTTTVQSYVQVAALTWIAIYVITRLLAVKSVLWSVLVSSEHLNDDVIYRNWW